MPLRRLALLVLALAALVTSACSESYQVAFSVGGDQITHSQFVDILDEWAEAEDFYAAIQLDPGPAERRSQEFVGLVLTNEILALHAARQLETQGRELSSDEREFAQFQLDQQVPAFGSFPDEVRERIVTVVAYDGLVQQGILPEVPVDATISPRYGEFDPAQGVIGPPGPLAPLATDPLFG